MKATRLIEKIGDINEQAQDLRVLAPEFADRINNVGGAYFIDLKLRDSFKNVIMLVKSIQKNWPGAVVVLDGDNLQLSFDTRKK